MEYFSCIILWGISSENIEINIDIRHVYYINMNWYIYRIQVGLHVYVLEYIIYNMGVGEFFLLVSL